MLAFVLGLVVGAAAVLVVLAVWMTIALARLDTNE